MKVLDWIPSPSRFFQRSDSVKFSSLFCVLTFRISHQPNPTKGEGHWGWEEGLHQLCLQEVFPSEFQKWGKAGAQPGLAFRVSHWVFL